VGVTFDSQLKFNNDIDDKINMSSLSKFLPVIVSLILKNLKSSNVSNKVLPCTSSCVQKD